MDDQEFRALHNNQQPEYSLPFVAWCRYFVECEDYDRLVCPMRNVYGNAMPSDSHDLALVNLNAAQMRKKHIAPLLEIFSREEIQAAKKAAGRLSYYQQLQVVFSEGREAGR